MGVAGYDTLGDLGPGIQLVRVEVAEFEAGDEKTAQTTVEVSLFDITPLDRCGQVLVFGAALHIGTGKHGLGTCLGTILSRVVPTGQEVADGTAVTGNDAVEPPLVAQDLLFVTGLTATGLTIDALVGAHDFGHLALLYKGFEGREVGFPKVTLGEILYIKGMAVPLRAAMHGEVLGAGEELAIAIGSRASLTG